MENCAPTCRARATGSNSSEPTLNSSPLKSEGEQMSANKVPLFSPEDLATSGAKMTDRSRMTSRVDAVGLEAQLRRNVEGEVRFDAGSKAMYAVDASNYREVPIGVVIPWSKEDVVQT